MPTCKPLYLQTLSTFRQKDEAESVSVVSYEANTVMTSGARECPWTGDGLGLSNKDIYVFFGVIILLQFFAMIISDVSCYMSLGA